MHDSGNIKGVPTLLTVEDVARVCRVNQRTVRRWIGKGELPVHRLVGSLRISEEDLILFINERRE